MIIEERGPDLLLHPLTRDAFAGTILQGCEMEISEIDWQRVVANWSLPVNVAKHNPTNPYRMGDAAGRREAGWPRAGLFASEDVRRQRNATSEKQRRKDESG